MSSIKTFVSVIFFLLFFSTYSQEKYTLSGTISDKNSNESLSAVNIFIPELKTSVISNEYGFYSITLPKGSFSIEISMVGYQNQVQRVDLLSNMKINFSLKSMNEELNEVQVSKNYKSIKIKDPEMSVNKLSIGMVKKMPVVLGEVDVLKSILLLPGVTNAGEGSSGFNVRGGGADQNLILLDEATIYNSSHVFGFFSVFNPDAIKDLTLYKGGIPSRYGGRASSVLEIYQKDGNSNAFHVNGGIGLITSRLLVEGPIVKDRGSFLVGGRGSYAHLFLKFTENNNTAYFYDFNAKLNYKLNSNNNLYASSYFGRDVFQISDSFNNSFGNATFNVRWNHLFSDKLFSNLSLIYSDYYYGLRLNIVGFNWVSSIQNFNFKYDFKYYATDKLKINYGFNSLYYDFNPGTISPLNDQSPINFKQLDKKKALENAVYFDAEQKISTKLMAMFGMRYSRFTRLGASSVNLYQDNKAVTFNDQLKIYEKGIPIGTKSYKNNQAITSFGFLEPRISLAYAFTETQSVKASYHRMVQYLQLISNTSSPTPLDVWTPADQYIKPQIADQVAVGYFNNLWDNQFSFEVESFFKDVKNRIDYIDGADLVANNALEQIVLNGHLRSFGLELLFRKNTGKWNGWISYTLSRSEQQTPGRSSNELGINYGKWYKTGFDKPHNVAITSSYELSKKWSIGTNFIFQTGQPTTYPSGQYLYQGLSVPHYGLRNQNRLSNFHHLDVSGTYRPKVTIEKRWQSEWVFSVYNLYNRKNAASVSFRQNQETAVNEAVRLSIFGAVPAVSYNFKF